MNRRDRRAAARRPDPRPPFPLWFNRAAFDLAAAHLAADPRLDGIDDETRWVYLAMASLTPAGSDTVAVTDEEVADRATLLASGWRGEVTR